MPDDLAAQPDAPLTPSEQQQLSELETTIERGLQAFYETGAALLQVRDARLYRATHATFDDYCRERWQMSKTNANRLIQAAGVVANVTPIGVIPANEAQARALARLPEAEQADAWQEVLDKTDGKPTGKATEQVVRERSQKPTPAAPRAAPANHPDAAARATPDPAQQPVHSATPLEVAELQQRLQAAMEEIRDLQAQVSNLHTANDAEVKEQQTTIARLQGRLAGLEGENERLKEEEAKARSEYNRAAAKLAKAPDAQELERLRSDNAWAHQKYTELKQRIAQAAPLREQAQQRAQAMAKSPLAHHIRKLVDLLDELAALLP
jgi:hypothetical protein